MLIDGDTGWKQVGIACDVRIPDSHLHGMNKHLSSVRKYNCLLFPNVNILDSTPLYPGYTFDAQFLDPAYR